jgi:hypothetical protein
MPFYEGADAVAAWEVEARDSVGPIRGRMGPTSPTLIAFTYMPQAYADHAHCEAAAAQAQTVLMLRRYANEHETYPETLDSLVPDYLSTLPIDPFSGTPLEYSRTGNGFLLYSVGRNRTDDGGVITGRNRDIVWRMEH